MAVGAYAIQLEYEPVGSEADPMVGGRITPPPGASTTGLTVEVIEQRSQWRSGAIRVATNGTFMIEVHAEKGRKCEFQIVLTDAHGTRLRCSPDRFAYTVGMVITSPPLTHNLGIAMANNKPNWLFRKGDPLPARKTATFSTVTGLHKSQPDSDDNVIRIPIIEGTNEQRADRNHQIGKLEIRASDGRVKRDVPVGSEVEVTIVVDESRTKTAKAFIGMLDEEFDDVVWIGYENRRPDELQQELHAEVQRLEGLREKAESLDDRKAKAALASVENQQVVEPSQTQGCGRPR